MLRVGRPHETQSQRTWLFHPWRAVLRFLLGHFKGITATVTQSIAHLWALYAGKEDAPCFTRVGQRTGHNTRAALLRSASARSLCGGWTGRRHIREFIRGRVNQPGDRKRSLFSCLPARFISQKCAMRFLPQNRLTMRLIEKTYVYPSAHKQAPCACLARQMRCMYSALPVGVTVASELVRFPAGWIPARRRDTLPAHGLPGLVALPVPACFQHGWTRAAEFLQP